MIRGNHEPGYVCQPHPVRRENSFVINLFSCHPTRSTYVVPIIALIGANLNQCGVRTFLGYE